MVLSVVLMAIGLVGVFAGYKMFKLFLAVSGFILGFNFGSQLFADPTSVNAILVGTVIGLVIGSISYMVYKLGIFVSMSFLSMEVARVVAQSFNIPANQMNEVGYLVVGVALGALAMILKIEKYILIVITTISGACYFIIGLLPLVVKGTALPANLNLFGNLGKTMVETPVLLVVFAVLVLLGILFQYQVNIAKK